MGWLWAATPSTKSSTPAQENQGNASPPPPASKASAPNEPVDPEIEKFFSLLTAENSKTKNSSESQQASDASSPDSSSSWFSFKSSSSGSTAPPPAAPPRDTLSEALLPTTMSCRQAFDLAWACNSVGGQWNAVYREGTMRSCSAHWDDFWFCMRIKSYSPEMREQAIRQHYRNKEHEKYGPGKPSSEDVWESRERLVEPGTAFAQSVEIAKVDDEEWRRAESERRRRIREGLGYDETS